MMLSLAGLEGKIVPSYSNILVQVEVCIADAYLELVLAVA